MINYAVLGFRSLLVSIYSVMKFYRKIVFFFSAFLVFSAAVYAQETGGVKGKVRTTKGEGISGASVTARQKGEDIKSTTADEKGNFVLEGLKPGNYNLVFNAGGYGSGVLYNVEIKNKKIGDLGDRLVLTVDRGTQVIIKGTVFDEAGRSVVGAKIEIEKINADGSLKKVGDGYTNSGNDPGVRGGDGTASGEFTFRFPEGAAKYRVTASFKDVKTSKEIEVEGAAIYRMALTLKLPN